MPRLDFRYMAPEVANPETRYGTKCDVWSVGIILFMILSGRFPYEVSEGLGLLNLAELVRKGEIAWVSTDLEAVASAEAVHFLKQLLMKDDVLRPSAEEALRHPWMESP